ncbi:MAG: mechanosensitive ion channel [Caldilineaceae bacterium]|nr:mechanosensitive ion channel [Caldilineaceae bacterium]
MNSQIENDPRFEALRNIIETALLVLERQAVQRQLIAFLVVGALAIFIAYIADKALRSLTHGRTHAGQSGSGWRAYLFRLIRALQYTLMPIAGLLLSQAVIVWFTHNDWPAGLLSQLPRIFWLVLIYRILLGLMQIAFVEWRARTYNRRFLAPLFLLIIAIVLSNSLAGTFDFTQVQLFTIMDTPITAQGLTNAFLILYFFIVFAWIVRDLINRTAVQRTDADSGAVSTITLVGYYTIVAIGVLTSLATLGFNLSTLAIIFGGLSVGLGFGLQELVTNFVSGILLLFERSLRVGDVIRVNNQMGTVDQLGMRATVLRTQDNEEIFVPNKDLLTSTVETYSYSNRQVRRFVAVGVAYASDPQRVRDILLGIAERHGRVLDSPTPEVFFREFGDSSLNFELAVWIDDARATLRILSDLRFMIFSEFAKNGIEIPFPQRTLHFPGEGMRIQGFPIGEQETKAEEADT